MWYVDTSVLIAALTRETLTATAQAWLAAQKPDSLMISTWTLTEVSSAFAIKLRTGHLSLEQRASALGVFSTLTAESFLVLDVTGSEFRIAARFADQHGLGLRAGDALHLAVASGRGARVCTLDQRLASAGPALGVPTHLLSPIPA